MDRLTSFDSSFLVNERENGHMAIGAVLVCEGEAPSHEDFLAHIRSRLHQLPRLRQRLAFPPLNMGRPLWVDHPEFEITEHVRRARLPEPGTDAQFRELVSEVFSPPLDRSRPLWQLVLVDGFEDDRFAVVYKTHHALADGISAVDIGILLFDVEPKFELVRTEAPWDPHRAPSGLGLAWRALADLGRTIARLGRWLRRAGRNPGRARRRTADAIAGLWEVSRALLRPAPKVPLNVAIGPRRNLCWATFSLADFKRIKNALGGTVNDVTLAVASGALRRWLEEHGVVPDELELKALVPVSVRTENEHGELGNRLTAMRGPLPVGVADPVERLRVVNRSMDELKSSKQPFGAEAIWALNDWVRDFAPPILLRPTSGLNFSTRLFNLLVTNFPGPQMPFYVLGRELTDVNPIGFLARDHAISIAIISYNGKISFGLLADQAAVPDTERFADHLVESVDELLAAARVASSADGDELAGDTQPRFAREREGLAGG